MATVIKNIYITIDGISEENFNCRIGDSKYYVSNIELRQIQGAPNILAFTISPTGLLETISDANFNSCGEAIGKIIEIQALSESSMLLSLFQSTNPNLNGTIYFRGIITNMEAERSARSSFIKVTAQSLDYLLTLGVNCRSFEGKTLKEIAEDVIDNYQGDVNYIANPTHTDVIPYTVQFHESDYEFLKRLASTYGEWLYSDGQQLIFGEMKEREDLSLSHMRGEMGAYKVETKPVNLSQEFISKDYRSGSYNIQPTIHEVENENHPIISKIITQSINLLHKLKDNIIRTPIGGNSDQEYDALRQHLSGIIEAGRKVSEAVKYSGTTFCMKMNIGTPLSIENSFISDVLQGRISESSNDDLFVTEITHYLNCEGGYANDFVGKPIVMKKAPGYSYASVKNAHACTAKVVDNEDPDNLGRIRVQFDWQETYDEEMYTPWLRMIHPYGGNHKGFSFIPEIGEEVMVDFVGGNPEKPFVLGTIFSGVEEPDEKWLPDTNKDNQVKAIRTRNGHTIEIRDEGEGGYIRIYDNEKENYILTFSTDDKLIKLESTGNIELYAKNDIIMHAGHDINASAGHNMSKSAENDIAESAGNDRNTYIGRNDSIGIEDNQFIEVGENKDEHVGHSVQLLAENIRIEAEDKLLEYSTTHNQIAKGNATFNAGSEIDIKAGIVKTN